MSLGGSAEPRGSAAGAVLSPVRGQALDSNRSTFTKDAEDCKIKQSQPNPSVGNPGRRMHRWMRDPWVGASPEDLLDRPHFPAPCVAQLLPGPGQPYHLFPYTPVGSKPFSSGLVLTRLLQRVACSPFLFAHERIMQEANSPGLKEPEVGNRHGGSS